MLACVHAHRQAQGNPCESFGNPICVQRKKNPRILDTWSHLKDPILPSVLPSVLFRDY